MQNDRVSISVNKNSVELKRKEKRLEGYKDSVIAICGGSVYIDSVYDLDKYTKNILKKLEPKHLYSDDIRETIKNNKNKYRGIDLNKISIIIIILFAAISILLLFIDSFDAKTEDKQTKDTFFTTKTIFQVINILLLCAQFTHQYAVEYSTRIIYKSTFYDIQKVSNEFYTINFNLSFEQKIRIVLDDENEFIIDREQYSEDMQEFKKETPDIIDL